MKNDGLRKEKFQTNVLSIRFIVPFICYNPTTTQKMRRSDLWQLRSWKKAQF